MPAIQPARLKTQAARLAETYSQPASFTRGLSDLMEEYADYTHRHGQTGKPAPLLPSFSVPIPVLRQVWFELLPFISSDPQAALVLSDALWDHPSLEHRTLAADILGQLPENFKNEVITRVQLWAGAGIEDRLIDALLERSLARLRSQSALAVTALVEHWLSSSDKINKQLGLRLLHSLASDPSFTDLPVLFRLLTPYLRIAPHPLRSEITSILISLIHRSAPEVAYLIHQNLTMENNPDTAWLLRQVISEFPLDLQAMLRESARRM